MRPQRAQWQNLTTKKPGVHTIWKSPTRNWSSEPRFGRSEHEIGRNEPSLVETRPDEVYIYRIFADLVRVGLNSVEAGQIWPSMTRCVVESAANLATGKLVEAGQSWSGIAQNRNRSKVAREWPKFGRSRPNSAKFGRSQTIWVKNSTRI